MGTPGIIFKWRESKWAENLRKKKKKGNAFSSLAGGGNICAVVLRPSSKERRIKHES